MCERERERKRAHIRAIEVDIREDCECVLGNSLRGERESGLVKGFLRIRHILSDELIQQAPLKNEIIFVSGRGRDSHIIN